MFNYSFINSSKGNVVSDFNFDSNNRIPVDRTAFYRKEQKIPLSFYNDVFIKTTSLLK